MAIDRRTVLKGIAAAPALMPSGYAMAQGLDASQFGVRPDAANDQSRALQRAIDQAASRSTPLALRPGIYKAVGLTLPAGASLAGVPGKTTLLLGGPGELLRADQAKGLTLRDLTFDGAAVPPGESALVMFSNGHSVKIADCEFLRAGGTALRLDAVAGAVTGCSFADSGDTALFSQDARGLLLSGNTIARSGNGGIRVWQSAKREDGTIVADNRIEDTLARSGGSGQNGNAINIYRGGNVIVRGNMVRNAAFSAVRGNAANNLQITGNTCAGIGEVAIYAEFDFEGASITGNVVDAAAIGIAVTNFNEGGRLATVQGNVLRNITKRRPAGTDPADDWGVGIGVEADTAVTGNVIENAANAGVNVGTGRYLRDVTVTGNVVRRASYGIIVSVSAGAGVAVVSHNVIADTPGGAVVGFDGRRPVTGDLAVSAGADHPKLTIFGNQLR
ncbi:MAG: TIGR03808 family TAT-translocated repetitive protein [Pseudolabrys sp.]